MPAPASASSRPPRRVCLLLQVTRLAPARGAGRIGGLRAADSLLRAVHARRLPQARAAVELCRAAPDLYVEERLRDPAHAVAGPVLAMAAGLRRKRSALEPLLDGLQG